jgi:hypothetical protein
MPKTLMIRRHHRQISLRQLGGMASEAARGRIAPSFSNFFFLEGTPWSPHKTRVRAKLSGHAFTTQPQPYNPTYFRLMHCPASFLFLHAQARFVLEFY